MKDTVFVTIKGSWKIVALKIAPGCLKIAKDALVGHKSQFHQLSGCIVHKYQQRSSWAAYLKKIKVRSIDLYQIPKTGSPFSQSKYFQLPFLSGFLKPFGDHNLPDTLIRDPDPMSLRLFFRCQGRLKAPVSFCFQIQYHPLFILLYEIMAKYSSISMDQAYRTLFLIFFL